MRSESKQVIHSVQEIGKKSTVYEFRYNRVLIRIELVRKSDKMKIIVDNEIQKEIHNSRDEVIVSENLNFRIKYRMVRELPFVSKKLNSRVGIWLNHKPLEGTPADPRFQVDRGRYGICFLFIYFVLKLVISPLISEAPYIEGFIGALIIYTIPLLLLGFFSFKFVRYSATALIIGLSLSLLGLLEFAIMLIKNTNAISDNISSVIFGLTLRIIPLFLLIKAVSSVKEAKNIEIFISK